VTVFSGAPCGKEGSLEVEKPLQELRCAGSIKIFKKLMRMRIFVEFPGSSEVRKKRNKIQGQSD